MRISICYNANLSGSASSDREVEGLGFRITKLQLPLTETSYKSHLGTPHLWGQGQHMKKLRKSRVTERSWVHLISASNLCSSRYSSWHLVGKQVTEFWCNLLKLVLLPLGSRGVQQVCLLVR